MMVGLRKLFPARPATQPGSTEDEQESNMRELYTHESLGLGHLSPGPSSPGLPSPGFRVSRALDASQHFEDIEKQFEDLHEQLASRPQTSQSYRPSTDKDLPDIPRPKVRHIDLMDALSSDRSPEPSPHALSSPTSPYNEDIAERNMTRFLRLQYRAGFKSAGILPKFYQEDVADRNIAKYGVRPVSSFSLRSSPTTPGRVRNMGKKLQKHTGKSNWTSDGDLRTRSEIDELARGSRRVNQVRTQRSAPTLSAGETNEPAIPSTQRLGVPSAHKQGNQWSSTPLPDSPTLPAPLNGSGSPIAQKPATITARKSSLTPGSLSPPASTGSTSRKNVRDLSINTQLAAKGRPKIAHKAIQPPTPSTVELKRAPSIAEVMNSPLPVPTPTTPTPSPRFKASEMMELFTKAYMSTRGMSTHPTYETLQDAIVREINSHEAFQHVPVPANQGPLFTPSDPPTSDKSEKSESNRSASVKQATKIRTKGSFKKNRRNSETRRSISNVVPSKSYETIVRRVASSPGNRRHTDAPAPSPRLVADSQKPPTTETVPKTNGGQPLTYMDVLARASSTNKTTNPRKRGNSESATNTTAAYRAATAASVRRGSGNVYSMQAHSAPSKDSKSSLSIDESDDDILHLPSVNAPPPRVQIEGVDLNNVHYLVDSSTPSEAQKLMSWPQREKSPNSQPATRLGPIARARMQLRGARSVETY